MTLDAQIARVRDHIQATGAVVVVGAGLSRPAGMPLVHHLAPLLWQAFDENTPARTSLAARLGHRDAPAKILLGHDEANLRVAWEVVRLSGAVRRSFQRVFAARDTSIRDQSIAHDALSRLFHRGVAEFVISFNWDTLFERSFARRYGGSLGISDRFWKPHGDAARPDLDWVLPGDRGQLPEQIIERVNALVRERPRLLLIIGYSESDEWVADQLTKPLSDRWLISRVGPNATGELALRMSADEVLVHLVKHLVPEPELPGWRFEGLAASRGLGPALMGVPLGIADAGACPRLSEVDQVLSTLRAAHNATLVGPPGCGKSLCAAQCLLDLSARGYNIVSPSGPLREGCELALVGQRLPHVVLVDNAHLESPMILRRLREMANDHLLLLVVATEIDQMEVDRGAVRIDARRAVATIARDLRNDLKRTLEAVSLLDDRVGEGYLDEKIEERISEAEDAELPWQFCFVLGGGWRRASQAVDAARAAGADLALVAAAVHQLAARDAPGQPGVVGVLAAAADISPESFGSATQWLVRERLLLSADDLRCPHQRLAIVVLGTAYKGLTFERRALFAAICRAAVADRQQPLLGVHTLLQTLWLEAEIRWSLDTLLGRDVEDGILGRCFEASDAETRMAAALVLTDLEHFSDDWLGVKLRQHISHLAQWIAEAEHPSGFGLARLVNNIYNRDKGVAELLCEEVDAVVLARAVSSGDARAAWSRAELMDRLKLSARPSWQAAFVENLDGSKLISMGQEWQEEDLPAFAQLAAAVGAYDRDLGLTMLESVEPRLRQWFSASPLDAFRNLDDVLFKFLRVWDPLGIFVGKSRPTARERTLARSMLGDINHAALAANITGGSRASLEEYASLLGFIVRMKPQLQRAVVSAIDLDRLDAVFEGHWQKLPREFEMLACQLRGGPDHEPATSWLRRHSALIQCLPARLAFSYPSLATEVVEHGGGVELGGAMTFEWLGVAYVIDYFARERRGLVERLVSPHVANVAVALARNQRNTYDHVDAFVSVLAEHAPVVLARVLDSVEPAKAEVAWAACLEGSSLARRSAARLIEAALKQGGRIAEVASRLRLKYPKASIPASRLSFEISGPRRSRRGRPRRRRSR